LSVGYWSGILTGLLSKASIGPLQKKKEKEACLLSMAEKSAEDQID
jgi:hypothetical protein